ncbi:DUF7408 domain-containing protein [Paenibacillus ginsengarvi]|nr:hypothetical protein [Paenibacillus ginsengarvi]
MAVLVFVVLAAGTTFFGSGKAGAEKQPLEISVDYGFEGKMKFGRWFPVKMTITNPGEDVSGDLTVRTAGDNGKSVVYTKHVDLPRQSTKIVWFTLPGKMMSKKNNVVQFYAKSVEKGAVVPFVQGQVFLETKLLSSDTLMVGIMARDPDTLNFLSLLAQKGYEVSTVKLGGNDFPWESAMLDTLDVIALNDAPVDTLKAEQTKEIESWVERGGKLVLAGGAGYSKTAAPFQAISPVAVNGTASVSELSEFAQATGKGLALGGPFTVSKAEVKSGEVLFAEAGIPLVVNRSYGQGSVTYVAYDLVMQPVASWGGNPQIWERILYGAGAMAAGNGVYRQPGDLWEMNNALEVFPQLVPPAYSLLTLLFLAYAVLVAPAMYFVLKKFDRREWAWFTIPSVAILTSLIIYGIGASGRGGTLVQTLGINVLSGSGTAARTEASSVFVPSGGSYKLEWSGKRNISSLILNDGGGLPSGEADMIVRSDPDKTVVSFANVPYWSVRKVVSAQEVDKQAGKFEYTLRFDGNGAKGEVTNSTPHKLYEAGIFINGQWIRIGDMLPGEKRPVQVPLGSTMNRNDDQWGNLIFPYSGRQDMMQRERSLLNSFSQNKANGRTSRSPLSMYIVGFAKSSDTLFKIEGKDVQSERIDLLVQPIEPDYVQGNRLSVPSGVILPYIESSNAANQGMPSNGGVDMGNGDITLLYALPVRAGLQYEKITLDIASQQQFKIDLWNGKSQAWENVQGGQIVLEKEKIAEALTGTNGIRLKVTNDQSMRRFTYPALSAEGAVKQ